MTNSRRKGAAFERKLAKRWRDSGLYPEATRRGDGQARQGDPNKPPDVDHTPWFIEAKDRKAHNPRKWLEQAEGKGAARNDTRPAVAVLHYYGDSMGDSIVCMRLSEWERLVGGVA